MAVSVNPAGTMPLNATGGSDSRRRTGVAPVSIFKKTTDYLLLVSRFVKPPIESHPSRFRERARRLSYRIGPAQTQFARLPGKAFPRGRINFS